MRPEQFARVNAIAARIHAKRHRGWNCEDMHPSVHDQHVRAFEKLAREIVQRESEEQK